MRNSLKFLLATGLFSGVASADKLALHCGDSTFAYNRASIVETDTGYELGIEGATLGKQTFTHTWGNPVVIDGWNRSRFFIPFLKNECVVSANREQVSCEKFMQPNYKLAQFYVEQTIPDLNDQVSAITELGAASIKINYTLNKSLNVSFKGAAGDISSETDIQKTKVKFVFCSDPSNKQVLFPQRLKDYIKNPPF